MPTKGSTGVGDASAVGAGVSEAAVLGEGLDAPDGVALGVLGVHPASRATVTTAVTHILGVRRRNFIPSIQPIDGRGGPRG